MDAPGQQICTHNCNGLALNIFDRGSEKRPWTHFSEAEGGRGSSCLLERPEELGSNDRSRGVPIEGRIKTGLPMAALLYRWIGTEENFLARINLSGPSGR
jgi:hypothetical protein